MAFTNQFSLSLELTKLIPFGSLVTTAGRGALHLMRELQDSGSDIITEADLAEVFGRNRIEGKFESTFRTAVKKSVIHKISEVAELVIEAGAGPTVRRSLNEPRYFATILQLSLLTYTHDLSQLARCLAKALEKRAEGATTPVALPRYDALKGTLRACREQTSGFPWELILLPVERRLVDIVSGEGPTITRPIPVAVLQALLDSFTAVQYLPESRFIHIESLFGISSIVVWAHHVLGLTVCVAGFNSTVRFGEGFESVFIDTRSRAEVKASLLNETKDLHFQVTHSDEDLPLDPACRHPVLGYGTRVLELRNSHMDIIEGVANATVTSCISLVQKESQRAYNDDVDRREKNMCPSAQRVVAVGKMLFLNNHDILENLNLDNEQPCPATSTWELDMLPENLARHLRVHDNSYMLKDYTLRLSYLLLVLSMVENLDTCGGLSLDAFILTEVDYLPFRLPNVHEAFNALALLLQGRALKYADIRIEDVAVLSAWGWSICVSSIAGTDPSEIRSGIAVCHGVPMRSGERKRFIVDTFHKFSGLKTSDKGANDNHIGIGKAGDRLALTSWTKAKKTRYFISATDEAFEVNKTISSEPMDISNEFFEKKIVPFGGELRVGFRSMQEMYWDSIYLSSCEHPASLGQITTLPNDTCVFQGLDEPEREMAGGEPGIGRSGFAVSNLPNSKDGSVHAGLVAGDSSARWILLSSMLTKWHLLNEWHLPKQVPSTTEVSSGNPTSRGYWDSSQEPCSSDKTGATETSGPVVFVRGNGCCFQCAINRALHQRRGRHVGLVL